MNATGVINKIEVAVQFQYGEFSWSDYSEDERDEFVLKIRRLFLCEFPSSDFSNVGFDGNWTMVGILPREGDDISEIVRTCTNIVEEATGMQRKVQMGVGGELVFDNWIEDESGDYANVCRIHEEFLNPIYPEPLDHEESICDVEGCYNIACFTILLDEEVNDECAGS